MMRGINMKIKKKELKRIFELNNDNIDLAKDGSVKYVEHLVENGADVYHAELLARCIIYEYIYNDVEDIRQNFEDLPYSKRSKKLLSYFKESASQWWIYWVVNKMPDIYSDLLYDEDFLNERRKDVEKAWKVISERRIERIIDFQRETFSLKK